MHRFQFDALERVIDHYWDDEVNDYNAMDHPKDHISKDLATLKVLHGMGFIYGTSALNNEEIKAIIMYLHTLMTIMEKFETEVKPHGIQTGSKRLDCSAEISHLIDRLTNMFNHWIWKRPEEGEYK